MINADPRSFVQTSKERFDVIFVDLPAPTATYVNRFYTVDFFRAGKRILAPGGVFAFRLPAASAYLGDEDAA